MPSKAQHLGFALLLATLGCTTNAPWRESGVPQALAAESLLKTATLGLPIGSSIGGSGGPTSFDGQCELDRNFNFQLPSEFHEPLMRALQISVQSVISNELAAITGHETGVWGHQRMFSYHYSWNGNEGVIRVVAASAEDALAIDMFCYEHQR
jgi:hypothetical protein